MPLLQRVLSGRLKNDHTIQVFRAAATLRYREATRLAAAGDRLAAIYLGEYAAEMLLKGAYFRHRGWTPSTPITMADLRSAKAHALATFGINLGNFHDLGAWHVLLVQERILAGRPYAPSFARSLNARAKRIRLNWAEWLRYHVNRPYLGEVGETLQAVYWLLGQDPNL